MMLTGMQGVTPNVRRAMRAIEGSGRRTTRHALDPVAIHDVLRVPASVAPKAKAVKAHKAAKSLQPIGRRPTLRKAAERVLAANPTMLLADVAKRAKCSEATARMAAYRLLAAGTIAATPRTTKVTKRDTLIAAIQADGTLSTKEYAAFAGVTTRCVTLYMSQLRSEGRLVRLLSIVDVDHA